MSLLALGAKKVRGVGAGEDLVLMMLQLERTGQVLGDQFRGQWTAWHLASWM